MKKTFITLLTLFTVLNVSALNLDVKLLGFRNQVQVDVFSSNGHHTEFSSSSKFVEVDLEDGLYHTVIFTSNGRTKFVYVDATTKTTKLNIIVNLKRDDALLTILDKHNAEWFYLTVVNDNFIARKFPKFRASNN